MAITQKELWQYYSNTYSGTLTETAFNALYPGARLRLDNLIFGRTVPDSMAIAYKQAFCELIDYRNLNTPGSSSSSDIEEETIDGYKVKYRSSSSSSTVEETESAIAKYYLTFPINLMYCGVVRKIEN